MNRVVLVGLAASLGVPIAVIATADEQQATVVVLARPDGAIGKRLAAELAALGLTVRMQSPSEAPIDETARALHVDGAVRATDTTLDVWLVEPGSGRTVLEHIPLGSTDTDQVTAIHRAVETLRTQLFEPFVARAAAAASSSSPPPALRPPPVVSASPTERPPIVSAPPPAPLTGVWVGPAVSWSGPVTQASADFQLGAWLRVLGPLRLEATLLRSLTTTSVKASAGSSDVESWVAGLAARVRFGSVRIGGGGGVGIAGVWLLLTGHATAPYVSDRADVLTLMPFAVAGLDFSPVRYFAVRADVMAGFTAPRASIVFADQPIADWGYPFLAATLAAEARWP